jgi:hypothetical protein
MPTIAVVTKNSVREYIPPGQAVKLGDQVFFTDDLVNDQGEMVGTRSGFCTRVRITPGDAPDPHTHECQATYTLPPQGRITTRGLANLPLAVGVPTRTAITGGTDGYANARGQVTVTQLTADGPLRLVIDIAL